MQRLVVLMTVVLSCILAAAPIQGESFIRGDCNADGNVIEGNNCDISDAIFLLNYLFLGGSRPPCLEACNSNDSPAIDIADAVYQLSFCFSGGPPPPSPFPDCGSDPTPSESCLAFAPCGGPDCEPQDARGVGPCDAILGIFWDGNRCRFISGCTCEGEDCEESYDSIEECYLDHLDCVCEPMDVVGVGPCLAFLGYYWDGRSCRGISGCDCEGEDCAGLYPTVDECELAHRACEPECSPMDARGIGPCRAVLGYRWDGRECEILSGCECEGEDCEDLYDTEEECILAHRDCEEFPCLAMRVQGVGPCDAVLGWYWDGTRCAELSGCECAGEDCDRLFATAEECERAYGICQ